MGKDTAMHLPLRPAVLALLAAIGNGAFAEPLAWIGDEALDAAQLDALPSTSIADAKQALYEARRDALQAYLKARLYAAEAQARGITPEQLHEDEVSSRIPAMSLADTRRVLAGRGITVDPDDRLEIAIARAALETEQLERREQAFLQGLRAKYRVRIGLRPPPLRTAARQSLDTLPARHLRGDATAPVELRVFSDYTCSHCRDLEETLDRLADEYPHRVRIVYHHFPLDTEADSDAMQAATLAECVGEQQGFWPLHQALHLAWEGDGDTLVEFAGTHGVSADQVATCLASETHRARVMDDVAAGEALSLNGAPVTFVNGMRVDGARDISWFRDYIEIALDDATATAAARKTGI